MGQARTALESVESSLTVAFTTCSQSSETSRTPSEPFWLPFTLTGNVARIGEGAVRLGQHSEHLTWTSGLIKIACLTC